MSFYSLLKSYFTLKFYNLTLFYSQIQSSIESKKQMKASRKSTNSHSRVSREDKQNICANIKRVVKQKDYPSVKLGQEIKNKIKSKQFQKFIVNDKKPIRQNTHLSQKIHQKIINRKIFQSNEPKKNHLSSISSTKSMKSVTFSAERCVQSPMKRNGHRSTSILKNKVSSQNNLNNFQKKSITSSLCSHVKGFDQSVQAISSNTIILKKYQRLYEQLKNTKQKYTDSIYPPYEQSIFTRNHSISDLFKKLKSDGYQVKWMRLTEIYKNKKLCVWNNHQKNKIFKGFISTSYKDGDYLSAAFNMIKYQNTLMEKLFQSQQVNNEGIYYVKIHQTQTNTWKYIQIDDFIPVIVSNKQGNFGSVIKPAFINIQPNQNSQIVELWPFLLQKAYAKYYSTYDSLAKGNTLDFIEEITGNFSQTFSLQNTNQPEIKEKIQQLTVNPLNIVMVEDKAGIISLLQKERNGQYIVQARQQGFNRVDINIKQICQRFHKIHYIQNHKYLHNINCYIRQQNLSSKQQNQQKKPFILRYFKIQQNTNCMVSVIQRQERFFRNGKQNKTYKYSWMRMLLVMAQTNQMYRWIDGEYGNGKTLKLNANLQPGDYYIILMPQWNSKPYDLNIAICTNSQTAIERKPYSDHTRIIELSCMDQAQRFGKLIQIHRNICTYNYINYKVGFITENINNQKTSEEIKVMRAIDSLSQYNIHPVNRQFGGKTKLEIRIKGLDSFTVVLKLQGGVDREFLEQFDFGC